MALNVSMTTDTKSQASIASITGDAGHDDLIVDIAETLSAIADADHLVVDITDTQHVDGGHLDRLLENLPDHVLIVHPTSDGRSERVTASLSDALQLLADRSNEQLRGGERECTS